ncbi:MAG: hypothetical protein M3P53_01620 [Actinomycetota bacterium]|nr:hypothetical protein [Actinomycetota bacterium]
MGGDGGDTVVALAHQGGWDEAGLVVAPMVILAVLLWLARRRAEREVDAEGPGARPDREPEPPLR